MNTRDKVIISCAVTGAIHTPSMTPYLPITPDEIAASAIAAAEAGAAILHLHARNPETGICAIPATDQAGDRCGHQHHHGWVALHDRG
jgi:uncharacterized protein (DUF849 family)